VGAAASEDVASAEYAVSPASPGFLVPLAFPGSLVWSAFAASPEFPAWPVVLAVPMRTPPGVLLL
jgi:hypothetical protein